MGLTRLVGMGGDAAGGNGHDAKGIVWFVLWAR